MQTTPLLTGREQTRRGTVDVAASVEIDNANGPAKRMRVNDGTLGSARIQAMIVEQHHQGLASRTFHSVR